MIATSAYSATTYRILRTYETPQLAYNPTIVEAILATMATPNWFDPVVIGTKLEEEVLVGGCNGWYNPIKLAFTMTRDLFKPNSKVASIVSIGPGRQDEHQIVRRDDDEGDGDDDIPITPVEVADLLERMMLDCEVVASNMQRELGHIPTYQRLSVDQKMDRIKITGWSGRAIANIISNTDSYKLRADATIDQVVDNLKARITPDMPTISEICTFSHIFVNKRGSDYNMHSECECSGYFKPRQ